MLRPMTVAPLPSSPATAKRSLTLLSSPPSCLNNRRNFRVPMNYSCNASPPAPSGCSRLWPGPAAYPSSDIEKLCTRSRAIAASVPASNSA